MKRKTFISIITIGFLIMAWASLCFGKANTKLIIFISPENAAVISDEGSRALFDKRLIPAENQLSKDLQYKGFVVMTESDVVPTDKLSDSEIAEAGEGNLKQIRKAAIVNSAHFIVSGFLDAEVTEEETLGMNLQKVVTTLSYKLYDTISAEVLLTDTASFTDVGKSPKKLFTNTLQQMSTEISQQVAQRIPQAVHEEQATQLARLQKQLGTVQVAPKDTGSGKEGSPQIVIINPPLGRGFTIAQKERAVDMEGLVIDHTGTGIKYFKINSEPVKLNNEGEFTYGIMLDPGENNFKLAAMSNNGRMVQKQVTLNLPDDKTPPDIVITDPLITRGFTTIVKDPVSRLTIKGLVKDDSEVQYIHVNGKPSTIDKDGNFTADVGLSGEQTVIAIVSADIFGNTAKKEFQVEKGQRGITSGSGKTVKDKSYKPVLWGLGIGVSQYSSSIMDLKYAAADVISMARFFESQRGLLFSDVKFKLLTDKAVTRDAIIESMGTHLGQAGPDDVVFIFVAGHGIKHRQTGSYYFVPSDADHDTIVSKGLRMSDFEEAVKILTKNVNKVIIAMDTCHSGAMEISLRAAMSSENLAETLREASGLYIVSASKGGEASMEGEQYILDDSSSGHGAFTYALITGMKGEANFDNDSVISLNELFQYVSRTVPRLTNGRQHPYLNVSGTDMPLVVVNK